MKNYPKLGAVIVVQLLVLPAFALAYQAAPLANTKNPTYITEKSAHFNGSVNANEMPDTYEWFEWGIVGRYDTIYETSRRGVGAYSIFTDIGEDVYGLAPSTQYFYRQIAESSRGKDIGQTTYFTTKPLPNPIDPIVIVETRDPLSVIDTSAVLRGYISPHQSTDVKWWFEWGQSNKFENETPHNGWGRDSAETQTTVTNLTSGTAYFYRIVAENMQGTAYGTTKVFVTRGLPPPPPEAPRAQTISSPQSNDGVNRKIATNQTANTSAGGTNASNGMFSGTGYPLNLFYVGLKQGNTSPAPLQTNTSAGANSVGASSNIAAAGAATPLGTFWNTLTGKKAVEVTIEKIGPSKVPEHTPVEYRISYAYRLKDASNNAKLKVILPASVVYIGDNTSNEFLLEEGSGGERTYVLPIGHIENGSTRTLSILGMTTSEANGEFPDARARLEYGEGLGLQVVAAGSAAQTPQSVRSTVSSSGFFPSSIFGWLLYILVIVGAIIGIKKAKAYYIKRKEEIVIEEERSQQNSERMTGIASGKGLAV